MLIDDLSKEELKNLLVKNWMAHDGAWFLNTYLQFGIDKANKLNKRAIKTLSMFETYNVKKLTKFADKEITTFEELKDYVMDIFSVLKGDFMDFSLSFPEKNRIHWEFRKCFAHESMKKLGVEEQYKCGVIYRVSCWLKESGIKHKIEPKFKKCLKLSHGKCAGDFITFL
ncbi:MAG: hypothetical protein GF383_00340 [Candidatus Lokiarchaeota archaeon]|nr:hypothetical protein [Candidatus Lokiarchaeota archaeon]MBD3337591.1 hypothetical protein [Candidatus Lokiarchaeota archaeon]